MYFIETMVDRKPQTSISEETQTDISPDHDCKTCVVALVTLKIISRHLKRT